MWITPWYPHPESPQEGDFIERLAKTMGKNCRVVVFAFHESHVVIWKKIKKKGVVDEWHFYYPHLGWKPLRFLSLTLAGLWSFFFCMKYQFDLVHAHVIFPTGHLAVLLSKITGRPLLISEHWSGYFLHSVEKSWMKFYIRCIARQASGIMPVSRSLQRRMQSLGIQAHYTVVPNQVDLAVFKPGRAIPGNGKVFKFLYVGSIDFSNKRVDIIVKAFSELSRDFENIALTLIGGGPDSKKLESLIKDQILSRNCIHLGALPHRAIAEEMKNANALVLFSKVETFSCVIAEAMAVGLPVISSRCGGLSESIGARDGIVLESGNCPDLKNAMAHMITHYEWFRPGLRRKAVASFAPGSVAEKITNQYRACLAQQ